MKKRRKRKNKLNGKQKVLIGILAALVFVVTIGVTTSILSVKPPEEPEEMRGIWIAYLDFKELGLHNKSKNVFTKNAEAFLQKAKDNNLNTVFFHVRAFRDATYQSETFPISKFLWDKKEPISYDPLKIMAKLAHKNGMQLHAWLNPYRNRKPEQRILNPEKEETTEEILTCVREIMKEYSVDGIHFDDYYYPETGFKKVSETDKRNNVNKMVKAVYKEVKSINEEVKFGISPAGNLQYAQSIGADIDTWLSQDGYVDYIIPQIYWTDKHSATWREKMFSDTLDQWISKNKKEKPLYVGLALYMTGKKADYDPGWKKSSHNLEKQLGILRERDCKGFVLFSAKDLYRKEAKKELKNFRKAL